MKLEDILTFGNKTEPKICIIISFDFFIAEEVCVPVTLLHTKKDSEGLSHLGE